VAGCCEPLLDDLVGKLLEMERNLDAERIRRFHINREFELCRA
jgi:hypothetical protein